MAHRVRSEHIDPCIAERVDDITQQVHAIERFNERFDLIRSRCLGRIFPRHFDKAARIAHKVGRIRAVGSMHRYAAAARDEADDIVTRNGIATFRQAHRSAVDTFDDHAV